MLGRLRRNGARKRQRSKDNGGKGPAIETGGKHHGSPWLQDLRQDFVIILESESHWPASRDATMPLLPLNRKDGAGQINHPDPLQFRLKTLPVWRDRGRWQRFQG